MSENIKDFKNEKIKDFVEELSSKSAIPGGGGASALVACLGTALGNMVGSLTVGKKKYAEVEDQVISLKERCDKLQEDFLLLIEEDAKCFEPLSKAYGLPSQTEEEKKIKEETLEKESVNACRVPLEIMEKCGEALEIIKTMSEIGSSLAISDAGAGAALAGGALKAASLNVFINTKGLKNREKADELNAKANGLLEKNSALADEIFRKVLVVLKKWF